MLQGSPRSSLEVKMDIHLESVDTLSIDHPKYLRRTLL